MRDEPAHLTPEQISAALLTYWGIDASDVRYAPVGYGSYHWTATENDGTRWFVTSDPRVGSAFERVRAAYDTAATLRARGLGFIHTPKPDRAGEIWRRISPTWAMSLSAYLDGRSPDYWTAERARVAELVGRLHAFSPAPSSTPRWEPPHWTEALHQLLDSADGRWTDGPYGEPARTLLARSAAGAEALLRHFERLVRRLAASDQPWVITHGEPHAGDVIVDDTGGMHLIDWDDTCLAPRERDLRILLYGHHQAPLGWENHAVVAAYQRTAGPVQPRPFVLELFRAEWALAAIQDSQFFRRPHRETTDTARRWRELQTYLPVQQNWPDLA